MQDKLRYNPHIHHRRSIRLRGYDYSQAGLYFITICCEDRECRFGKIKNDEMILNEYGTIAYNEWIKLTERFSNFELDVFQIMPNHMHGIIALNDVGAGFTSAQNTPPDKPVQSGFTSAQNTPPDKPVQSGFTSAQNTPPDNPVQSGFTSAQNTPPDNPVQAGFTSAQNTPPDKPVQSGFTSAQNTPPDNPVQSGFTSAQNTPPDKPVQSGFTSAQNTPPDNPVQSGFTSALYNDEITLNEQSPNGQPQGLPLQITDNDNRATARSAPTIGDIVGAYKSLVANECLKIWKTKWVGANPVSTMGKLWQRNYYEHIIRNEQSYQTISEYIINNPSLWKEDKFFQ